MAPVTMSKISTVTVGAAGASTIDFTNIPQIYTDLKIVISSRVSYATSGDTPYIDFNGLTTNRTSRWLEGTGSNIYSSTGTRQGFIASGTNAATNAFGSTEIYIPNYTSSNYKSFSVDSVTENNGTTAFQWLIAGLWSSGDAITRITFTPTSGNFVQYTTATLYGIKSASTGAKARGGNISQIGNYYIHTFNSTATFTPLENLTVEYLVVAGGGGGGTGIAGQDTGGGGGAGGARCTVGATGGGGSLESPLSLTSNTAYTVTVGAGGSANNSGSDSSFSTITSVGGGRGAGNNSSSNGATGGSGGGGRGSGLNTGLTGGSGTTNQGYGGGTGVAGGGSAYGAGGGGGANSIGANGSGTTGGNGGSGLTTSISGASTTYAGGGGGGAASYGGGTNTGGTGGSGGGGNGGFITVGNAATVNTGGGGGGAGSIVGTSYAGGTGGSGVVIIRYSI